MEYFGLKSDLRNAGFYETKEYQKILKDILETVHLGRFIALNGVVGCGKTVTLRRIQDNLRKKSKVLVSKSLSVEKDRVTVGTLITALFYDLTPTGTPPTVPSQTEKRERKLQELMISTKQKFLSLFVDEAHDLHHKTLVRLKRLFEVVEDIDGKISIILAGHPKLQHDLDRPSMGEIGNRMTVFNLEGIKNCKYQYLEWLIETCTDGKLADLLEEDAINLLTERLSTPLQYEHYLTLALEKTFKIGQRTITADIIENILTPGFDGLEPKLTRNGYDVKTLADMLHVRPLEIRKFLHGKLSTSRTQEIRDEMLANGIPL